MQRDGGKLADVLDGAVPGCAVIHFGDHPQINPVNARLLQHALHDVALARGREENLIDKLLARVLEKHIQRAHHVV